MINSPFIRFCAAVPLVSSDGQIVAVLSIYGKEPREPRDFDLCKRQYLTILGKEIVDDVYQALDELAAGDSRPSGPSGPSEPSQLQCRLSRMVLEAGPSESKSRLSRFVNMHMEEDAYDPRLIPQPLDIRKVTEEPTPPPTADPDMGPGPDIRYSFDQYTEPPSNINQFMDVQGGHVWKGEEPTTDVRPHVDSITLYRAKSDLISSQENMNPPPVASNARLTASNSSTRSTTNGASHSSRQESVVNDTRQKQHYHQESAPPSSTRRRLSVATKADAISVCKKIATDLKFDLVCVVEVAMNKFELIDGRLVTDINAAVSARSCSGELQAIPKESMYNALCHDSITTWAAKGGSVWGDDLASGDLWFIHTEEKVPAKQRSFGYVLVALRTDANKNRLASRSQELVKLNKFRVELGKVLATSPTHHKNNTVPNTRYPANEATEVVVPSHPPIGQHHYYQPHR